MTDNATTDLKPWAVYGEKTVYDSPWVRLALVDVEPPDTARFEHHVVRLFRVAIAVVLDADDRVLMLWRYRFVPDRWGWELPGGIVEPGEDSVTAAAREVEEETGWRPGELRPLLTYQPMVGMVDSPHDLVIGRGATQVGTPGKGEEAGRVAWVPLSKVPDLMARGELLGSGTLVGLLHVLALGPGTRASAISPE